MAQISVTLKKGIIIGGVAHTDAVLREATALDVIQATADSERVVIIDRNGQPVLTPQLVASPTMTGINILRKQIVSIGPMKAPIDDLLFEKLSPDDLNILQRATEQLEDVGLEVAHRGRTDDAGAGSS